MKYKIIKEWLWKQACRPESRLRMPTVREIMRHFNVSQAPVSRALQELEREGIIKCRQGAGIVAVSENNVVINNQQRDSNGTIVFAYTDYPTEMIWQQEHIYSQLTIQNNFGLSSYRSYKGDNFQRLPGFLATTDNLRGIIIHPTDGMMGQDLIKQLSRLKVPVIINDSGFSYDFGGAFHVTQPDPVDRGKVAIRYLYEAGHRRICVIRNEPTSELIEELHSSMRDEMATLGLSRSDLFLVSETIKYWDNSMEAAQRLTESSLPMIRENDITAIIYHSTAGAFAALQTLLGHNLRVPQDLSLIGFGEYSYARYTAPAMTVCTCDYTAMAGDAFHWAAGLSKPKGRLTRYPHKVIERKSVAKLTL